MATWIDFKELRSRLKMPDVLAKYGVQLKVRGDRASGFCPLPGHKSKADGKRRSPSFSCNLSKGIFQCFSCGGKGNCLDLVCLLDGGNPDDRTSIRNAALKAQEMFGLSSSKLQTTTTAKESPPPPAITQDNGLESSSNLIVNAPLDFELNHLDAKHPYLSSRGFIDETIRYFGLGYCTKGMMAERIAIPLHDTGAKLIGYAGRLVDDSKVNDENPKYRFPGTRERDEKTYAFRKSEFLYNAHRIRKPVNDLIVVEGFPSVWWLHQHGYRDTVALMGSSISTRQSELLHDLVLRKGRLWILSDGDPAGEHCARDVLFQIATGRFVRWVKLAEGQPTDLTGEELRALIPIE